MIDKDVRGIMEAYGQVYSGPEELNEIGGIGGQKALDKVRSDMAAERQSNSKLDAARAQRFGGVNPVVKAAKGGVQGTLDKTSGKWTPTKTSPTKPAAPTPKSTTPTTSSTTPKPAPSAAPKPSAAAKPAPSAAPKPSAAAKPAGSAMDQWAAANPKLAAAKAERDRTRGTSATTNPLMKDTKSSLPAPKSPTPTSAPKPTTSTLSQATAAASKPSAFTPMKKEHLDIFDIVKGHLLDEGYAETEEAAMVIMTNMSEEWRESILDENRMASRMGKMSSPPAKVGKATHSIKDLVPSKPPSEEEKEKARKALRKEGLDPVGQEDDDVDNDGKKNTKSDKYLKNRRKVVGAAIQKEELEAWVDQLIAEGYDLSEYTWEEVAEIYAEELELAESGKNDARIRGNIKSFGSNYTPPRDWDQSANRGQGAVLNDKQKEKQRRKSLRQEELELGENRRMAADPEGRKSGYSKQPDPSKEGFTGIGNMSIKQIMAMNKKIAAKKKED